MHRGVSALDHFPIRIVTQLGAQWGNRAEALKWLETAMRLGDPALAYLRTDPLMDPLRKEPRFQAIERALTFPN